MLPTKCRKKRISIRHCNSISISFLGSLYQCIFTVAPLHLFGGTSFSRSSIRRKFPYLISYQLIKLKLLAFLAMLPTKCKKKRIFLRCCNSLSMLCLGFLYQSIITGTPLNLFGATPLIEKPNTLKISIT